MKKSYSEQVDFSKILKRGKSDEAHTQAKTFYQSLSDLKNDDIYQLLQQSYKRVNIKASAKMRSYFSREDHTVYIARNSDTSTIAHELFHEIDRTYQITENGALKMELERDYKRLLKICDRKPVQGVLYSKYPEMFEKFEGELIVKPEYRGISDIIHGMTEGKVNLGYRHSIEYWKKPGALQKEAWAQYGRMYYSEDKKVLSALKEFFPETTKEFERIVREMVK